MNRLVIALIVLVAAFYIFVSSVFVVNERQQVIVTRFGEIRAVHTDPGLYFKIPTDIIDRVQVIEDRLLRYDLDDIRVQVSDGKFYDVDAFLTYRITDPSTFRRSVGGDVRVAEQRIDSRFNTALRDIYGKRDFNAALSVERTAMMREARDTLRAALAEIGIEIDDVRILRTELTPQVSQQTFDRMSAERQAEAALSRASGQEQAQIIRASADRQAISILAEANRTSEILRGEGDGERNRIFAEAFSEDAEFFRFYRSLQAYREALVNSDTSLVLSPDSEFFEYFSGSIATQVPATTNSAQ